MIYQIKNIDRDDMCLIETTAAEEVISDAWNFIWWNNLETEEDELIDMLVEELQKSYPESERVFVTEITP